MGGEHHRFPLWIVMVAGTALIGQQYLLRRSLCAALFFSHFTELRPTATCIILVSIHLSLRTKETF